MATWGRTELAPPPGFAERVAAAAARRPSRARPPSGASSTTCSTRWTRPSGRIPLPGGRTIPVKNVLGYGIAATAVLIQVERYLRRTRELKPL